MTAAPTTITTNPPTPRPDNLARDAARESEAFLSRAEGETAFADVLSSFSSGAAPALSGPATTTKPTDAPQDAVPGADKPDRKRKRQGAKRDDDQRSGKASPNAAAAITAGLPLTINTLNQLLLQGEGAKPRATADAPDSSVPRGVGEATKTSSGDKQASVEPAKVQTTRASAVPTAAAGKESAGITLRVQESGIPAPQAPAQAPKPGTGAAANTESRAQVTVEGAQATGALTKAAVAAPAPIAAIRSVSAGASGGPAPVAGITGAGAQGPRGSMRMLRTEGAPPSPDGSKARTEAFQAQLARGMAAALKKGEGTLTLRLKPESLGQLQVKVSMKDGVLSARFEAQTREARDLLLATSGDLRGSLEAAGVSVERVEASVSPHLSDQASEALAFSGLQLDAGGTGEGSGTPDRNDSGPQSRRRGTDAAQLDGTEDAAEPRAQSAGWLVLGLDTIA